MEPGILHEYQEQITTAFLTPPQVSELLVDIHRKLHAAVGKSLPEFQKALPSVADDDENFAGPEAKPIKPKKIKVKSK